MNLSKRQIKTELLSPSTDICTLKRDITAYKEKYPYDVDMYLLEGYFYLGQKDIQKAQKLLQLSLTHNPYNVDTFFLLGEVFAMEKEYCKAIRSYSMAGIIDEYIDQEYIFFSKEVCNQKLSETVVQLDEILASGNKWLIYNLSDELKELNNQIKYKFDVFGSILANNLDYIGKSVFIQDDGERFCAFANGLNFYNHPVSARYNFIDFKGELLKIQYEGTKYEVKTGEKLLLPVASKEQQNVITFQTDSGKRITVRQSEKNAFSYFRITENAELESKKTIVIGEPVRLKHDSLRKKLVISFFVDGLSQRLLFEEGLENVMPNTFRFFSKGLICNNFFTSSDWTYPSLASFVSGISLPVHMLFHPTVNKKLPNDRKTIFEYLKNAGYYTARFNGDWRSNASYGYTRGIDRYIAQHANHYNESGPIIDAIEHIETFKETDLYVWLEYNDLHHIADELDLPAILHSQMELSTWEAEKKSITSIKQSSSMLKRGMYIQAMKLADFRFQFLYDYLERNFADDEYIVTMFGDHGQTYLLQPGEFHLARYHSNVAFMVRGGGGIGESQEYMSAVDYPDILCSLANVGEKITNTEGNLPKVFGGKEERPFAITETIHPNDPYQAAIHAKDHVFYFTTENRVTPYGRLDFGNYSADLLNLDGKLLDQPELTEYYIRLIKNRLKYIITY